MSRSSSLSSIAGPNFGFNSCLGPGWPVVNDGFLLCIRLVVSNTLGWAKRFRYSLRGLIFANFSMPNFKIERNSTDSPT